MDLHSALRHFLLGPGLLSSLVLFLVLVIGGCAPARGPERIQIPAQQYPVAFTAAEEAAVSVGMPPLVSDRVGGVIEGRPRLAGSLVEPWRVENSAGQAVENTINKQRRRIRFEFLPKDFRPPEPTGEDELRGAVVPGSTIDLQRSIDLLAQDDPIEIRVWVYVERQFVPYLQQQTWSRVGNRFARNPLDTIRRSDTAVRSPGLWTPVGRDQAMEQRLLARVRESIDSTTN
ncbi:MAG: hypothetical protein MK085_06045 [Phycisphaerales bacterium]|nr:hypothetical protein [Phycisphaerales bacterium]